MREMTTSWNALQNTLHSKRQNVVAKRAPNAVGTEETGIPGELELTSLS